MGATTDEVSVRTRADKAKLFVVLLALTFVSIVASAFAAPESPLTMRVHRASVTQRLVMLGYERADAARAVEALPPQRLAHLAGSLGRPSAGFVLLTVLCLAFTVSAVWLTLLVV